MRPAPRPSAALIVLFLGGCGDGGLTGSAGSTGTGSTSGTTTTTTTTMDVPTTSETTGTTTGVPTSDGSGDGSSTTGAPGTTEASTSSSGEASTTTEDTSATGTTSTTSTSDTTSTTDTTGDSSTGDGSSSSGSSTGDTDTGGGAGVFGYMGMASNDTLVRFDLTNAKAMLPAQSLLPQADYPYGMRIKPDGSELWVVGAAGDGVKVVDAATGSISQSIDLADKGDYPVDVLFNVDGTLAYVSARDSNAVVVIDAVTYAIKSTIPLGIYNGGKMTLDPCTGKIFMVDWFDKSLLVVEPATKKVTPILLGISLWDLALDPATDRLYVADRGSDKIHVFATDTMQFMNSVVVGDDPWGIDLSADGELLVVSCEDDHTVHVFATDTMTGSVLALPADADPRSVAIDADALRAYVTTGEIAGEDGVYEIDLVNLSLANTIVAGPSNFNSNIVAVRPQTVLCP